MSVHTATRLSPAQTILPSKSPAITHSNQANIMSRHRRTHESSSDGQPLGNFTSANSNGSFSEDDGMMDPNSAGTDGGEHDFGSFADLDETSSPVEEFNMHHPTQQQHHHQHLQQQQRSSMPPPSSLMTGGIPAPSQLIMNNTHHQMLAPSQLISPQYM